MGYDQWKTASPFDDEPDFVEIAEKWLLTNNEASMSPDPDVSDHYWMIQGLVDYIADNV